jgi:hypothetical protein
LLLSVVVIAAMISLQRFTAPQNQRSVGAGADNTAKPVADPASESWRYFCARNLSRECGGYNTRKGKKPAGPQAGYQLPAPAPIACMA